MFSGVINTAFSYLTASASDTGGARAQVRCSTADEEGKSTVMSPTNFTRQRLFQRSSYQHQQYKESVVEPKVSPGFEIGP